MIDPEVRDWLRKRGATEVELFIPDLTGIPRGKIVPCEKFLQEIVRLPESAIAQTVTGDWGEQEEYINETDTDMELRAGLDGCFAVPWAAEPTGQIICDCVVNGRLIRHAPRSILKRALRMYQREGWRPIVAPELEFYLAKNDANPDNPLSPPVGRTGRPEFSSQPFSIDAVNEFEPVIEDIYRFAEAQELAVDTLTHEEGVAQFEINFQHGDALEMADQVMVFKRCVREAAIRHGITATFMAKPSEDQPGSSMHIHQSVVSRASGENLFAQKPPANPGNNPENPAGLFSPLFLSYVGGLQRHLPEMCSLYLPNINSFRRINMRWATSNVHWGVNNRTVGFRIPDAVSPKSLRVENRICGADANPYLAIAASLLAGWLGMRSGKRPARMIRGAAWDEPRGMPLTMERALELTDASKTLRERFGNRFVDLYVSSKRTEMENFKHVVTSWERKYLLSAV